VATARHDFIERCGLPEDEFLADAFEYAKDAGRAGAGADASAP